MSDHRVKVLQLRGDSPDVWFNILHDGFYGIGIYGIQTEPMRSYLLRGSEGKHHYFAVMQFPSQAIADEWLADHKEWEVDRLLGGSRD